jgi:hypothetical protein
VVIKLFNVVEVRKTCPLQTPYIYDFSAALACQHILWPKGYPASSPSPAPM